MWTNEVPSWSPTYPWPVSLQNIYENWCWSAYIIPAKTCLFPKTPEYSLNVFIIFLCLIMQNSSKLFHKIKFADLCSYWAENKWGKQEINPLLCCFLLKPLTQITQRRESIIGLLLLVWKYWLHHRWYFFPFFALICKSSPPPLQHLKPTKVSSWSCPGPRAVNTNVS